MILFVDDESFYVDSYVAELRDAGFEVDFVARISAAMKIFEEEQPKVDLVITDMMLSSEGLFKNTDAGFRTGCRFYDWVRERSPNLPIVVLTNANAPDLDAKFSSAMLLRKDQCLPFELVQHVREMLESRTRS